MLTPAGTVNQALWVLNPKTDGEGFGFDKYATLVQQGKGVAGAVAQRQDRVVTRQFVLGAVGDVQDGEPTQLTDSAAFCSC